MNLRFLKRALVFSLAVTMARSVLGQPYSEEPTVMVATDKSSYSLFEPIIIDVTLTNNNSVAQRYGPVGVAVPGSALHVRVKDPNGEYVRYHGLYSGEYTPVYVDVSYEPGESRSASGNLMLTHPVWRETGTYSLEAYFVENPSDWSGSQVLIDDLTFDVVFPVGVDSTIVDSLRYVAEQVFELQAWPVGPPVSVPSVINNILALQGLPPYLREFARYAEALFKDLDSSFGSTPLSVVEETYSDFLSDFPTSVYKEAVEQGYIGLLVFAGSAPYTNQADTLRVLRIKALLEGPHVADSMKANITSVIPTSHPFGADPWFAGMPGSVYTVPEAAVDWLLVTLVDADTVVVGSEAGLLYESGVAEIDFLGLDPDSFFVVVDHRNHIAVMSDTLVDMTGGFAEHDFTTGHAYGMFSPQKQFVVGQDTIYRMWAGDGKADGQITAPDFNAWNAATTAGATGYQPADYNMESNVTAPDFNLWNANTTAGAATRIPAKIWDALFPSSGGESQFQVQQQSSEPQVYVRLDVRKDNAQEFWVKIQAKADSSLAPNNTFGSATIDVDYDATELTPGAHQFGVLTTGYPQGVRVLEDENGTFLRYWVTSLSIGTGGGDEPGHSLDTGWETLRELRFTRTPPKGDDGTSIRLRSLSIGFYDSPSDSNGTNNIVEAVVEVQ